MGVSKGIAWFCSSKVSAYLLRLGPLLLGEQLVDGAGLERTSDSVDTVVSFFRRQALQCLDDVLVLLDNQVVGSAIKSINNPSLSTTVAIIGLSIESICVPKTELAVPGGICVPACDGLEHVLQPRPLEDEGRESRVRRSHCDGWQVCLAV